MKMEPWPHFQTLHGGELQELRQRTCRKNCSDSHRYFLKNPRWRWSHWSTWRKRSGLSPCLAFKLSRFCPQASRRLSLGLLGDVTCKPTRTAPQNRGDHCFVTATGKRNFVSLRSILLIDKECDLFYFAHLSHCFGQQNARRNRAKAFLRTELIPKRPPRVYTKTWPFLWQFPLTLSELIPKRPMKSFYDNGMFM